MSSVVQDLNEKGLLNVPKWLPSNTMFEGWTGSVSYGASGESSDVDVVGFCMPPKTVVFPHLDGHIPGFGTKPPDFQVYQEHHIKTPDGKKEYDLTIYSIIKFFQLVMENNPNLTEVLFLPRRCVLHSTELYEHVRHNRKLFLHKGSYYKFRGYAVSQLSKLQTGVENPVIDFIRSKELPSSTTKEDVMEEIKRRGL